MVERRVQGTSIAWREWVDVPGGEGSDLCLTQFLVSTDPQGAPFTSIATAYAAAKAAGHGPGNPAQVLVCPGTYSDPNPLVLDTAEIDIIAVTGDSQQPPAVGGGLGQTVYTQQVLIDLAFAGSRNATTMRWSGIDIRPPGGTALFVAGPNNAASYIYVTDCQIITANVPIQTNNTGIDGFDTTTLDIQRCNVESTGGQPAVQMAGAPFPILPFILGANTVFQTTLGAVFQVAESALGLDSCLVLGSSGVQLADSVLRADDTLWQVDTPVAFTTTNDVCRFIDNKATADPNSDFILGDGVVIHDTWTFLSGDVPPYSAILNAFTDQAIPQEANALTVTVPAIITSQTNILGESGVGGGPILLPPVSSRAGVLRLKLSENNLGPVTVDAQGGDMIRLGGAAPAVSVPLTDDGFFLVANPLLGYWEGWSLGGGGGVISAGCLGEYLVSPDPATAPFQSIQDAIDQAVLDGADPITPAKVLVCPGDYIEQITLSQPGIDVVAVAPDDYDTQRQVGFGITRVLGTVTVNLTGFSPNDEQRSVSWRGIDILGQPAGPGAPESAIVFTGTGYQQLFVTDCILQGDGADPGLLMNNTGVGAVLDGVSRVDCIRVKMLNPNLASASGFDLLKGLLTLNDCVTTGQNANLIGDGAIPAPRLRADGCRFHGFDIDDGSAELVECSFPGVTFLPNGGDVDCIKCDTFGAAAFSGPGIVTYDYFTGTFSPTDFFPTLSAVTQRESVVAGSQIQHFTLAGGAGVTLLGGNTNILINATDPAVPSTVTLPPIGSRWGPIRVKNRVNSLGSVDVFPPPGATLNEGAGPISLAPGDSVTVCAIAVGGPAPDWESYN